MYIVMTGYYKQGKYITESMLNSKLEHDTLQSAVRDYVYRNEHLQGNGHTLVNEHVTANGDVSTEYTKYDALSACVMLIRPE